MKRVRDIQWKGDRGEGSIFFFVDAETGRKISPNLYVFYRAGGKEHLVSAMTGNLSDAKRDLKRLLRNRENANEGKEPLVTPKTEKVTVGELLDTNLERAREHGRVSAREMSYQSEILKTILGSIRAINFRPEHRDDYIRRRKLGEGSRDGRKVSETTIRHELEVLRVAFNYAVKRRVLHLSPYIEMPGQDVVRQREIPLDKVPAILKAMPDEDARDFVEWFFLTVMRPRGIGALRWEWLDLRAWELHVPAEKGGNARPFAIEGTLRAVIERRIARRRLDCPFIFHRDGEALDARRVRDHFYVALAVCKLPTGRSGFTLYDLKKTGAGALIDSGLDERAAMHFSGHKTPSMFDRYVIKSADRHRASVRTRDAWLEKRLAEKKPADTERVIDFPKVFNE